MNAKLFFAGSGGQGILLMGQMLATAAMRQGREVTFLPSYGPEMRGGTANCTVILSEAPISCPVIYEADVVCAMNLPSLTKFESLLKPGGKLFINASLIAAGAARDDIEVYRIPANETAASLGDERAANTVMLGAIVAKTGLISRDAAMDVLAYAFSGPREKLLPLNQKAFFSFYELRP